MSSIDPKCVLDKKTEYAYGDRCKITFCLDCSGVHAKVAQLVLLMVVILATLCPAQNTRDSLRQIVQTRGDTTVVLACHSLGKLLAAQEIDSAYYYLKLGADLSEDLNFQKGKLLIWRSLGSVEARRGNYEASKSWTQKGLDMIAREELPIINRVDYLINYGVADYFRGNIGTALEPHIEAVEICRKHGFDEKRAKLLNNIGIFYRQLKRYDDAIRIYQEGVDLRKELKDTAGIANIYHNMAAAYSFMDDHENALAATQKSRVLYEYLGSHSDLLLCELSMGTALQRLGRLSEARPYLVKLAKSEEIELPPHHQCLLALSLAELEIDAGQPDEANTPLANIKDLLFSSDFKDFQIKWFELNAEMHEALGNQLLANNYLRSFIEASEAKSNEETASLRQEMEAKYLSQEKDHQITLLSTERQLAQAQLQNARQRNLGLLLGFAVLALFSFIMFGQNRQIKKQNIKIKAADQEKTILLKEIHHRVKNNLQVISALLELQSTYLQDAGAKEALLNGQNRVASMALIHRDLYQTNNLKGVNIKDYIAQLVENLSESYQLPNSKISIQQQVEPIYLDVDTMIPLGLLVNELIGNAFKHAFHQQDSGHVLVKLSERDNQLELIVEDNGSGIDDIESSQHHSFGYSLIQSFAEKLDAEILIQSEHGLTVTLLINSYLKASQAA